MSGGVRAGLRGKRKQNTIGVRRSADTAAGKRKSEQRLSRALLIRTLILLAVCGVAAFVVLAVRLYDVQVVNNSYFESRTLNSQLRQTTITATRGTIFDANGKILAMSGPVENVFISPLEMVLEEQDVRFIAEGLSYILGVDFAEILEKAGRTSSQYQVIKHHVESDETGRVREFIKDHDLSGIHFEAASRRYYPNGNLASQVLGFVGTDNIGLDGIEQRFDEQLTGVSGRNIRLTNAKGNELLLAGFGDHLAAKDGNDITLTLNMSIQYYVEKHLTQAIIDYDILGGAMCIAMDPRTGEILAIANYPNFDPNNFLVIGDAQMERLSHIDDEEEFNKAYRDAQFRHWRNQSLADTYEPGSVFKILTYAMALEENAAGLNSTFNCMGSVEVRLFEDVSERNCWRRWGHGELTFGAALNHSCNVACIELGIRIGPRTFYEYVEAFGLFHQTGLDNAIEGRGIWWDENVFFDRRNETQLASASFGQTFQITPIQMITAAAATVNGGYLMQPHIVKQITDSNGNIVEVNEPTVVRQVISSETSRTIQEMMEDVVTSGTGINAQVRGYRIGGKTGTSENVLQLAQREEDDTSEKDYIVSFLGFAPADNPEIMILLLLDTPNHETGINISGGSIAAPVVGRMFEDILPLSLGILPEFSDDELADMNVHVPRLTGRSIDEAIEKLTSQGYDYQIVGDGDLVTAQLPRANAFVSYGTKVTLYADEEVPRNQVTVPQLSGMSYTQARQILDGRGLFIRTGGAPKSDSYAVVSVQSIEPGREAQFGSIVEVTLINALVVEQRTP